MASESNGAGTPGGRAWTTRSGREATAGVWESQPVDRPEYKAKFAAKRIAAAKAEESIGS